MISVADIARRLMDENTALSFELTSSVSKVGDQDLQAVATLVATGLAALHERQGDAILLMLRSAT